MPLRWRSPIAATALLVASAACGTDAVGVDACKRIEEARCQQAPACGIALEPPYHTSGSDVSACIRFYDDDCLHGLASGTDPGPTAVAACVTAIEQGGCSVVLSPSSAAACAWLAPSVTASDASDDGSDSASDGDAADAGTE
jgi:hypothetical protein